MSLVTALKDAQKDAMRAKDKGRLGTIRLALAAIKQLEIDTRTTLNDADVIAILTKMVKQRNDSIAQFQKANRQDLVDQEQLELDVLRTFLPKPLSAAELQTLIAEAIAATDAANMRDMGKVMAWLKPQVQGRADMGQLSKDITAKLKG